MLLLDLLNPPPIMPSKRPIEDPPSASSSEEVEEEDLDQEAQQQTQVEEGDSDESEADFDSPLDIKPISSKPMAVEPTSTASGSSKRRSEADEKDTRKDKKKKKVSDLEDTEAEKKSASASGGEDQKKMFQKLWTDEDEIVILKGMHNFKKKGNDPSAQVALFFDTIKCLLHTKVDKTQVHSKIRTLKRKFQNAAKKVKNVGEDPDNLKPHELEVYRLSKKVWPDEIGKEDEGTTSVPLALGVASPETRRSKKTNVIDGVKTEAAAASPVGVAAAASPVGVTSTPVPREAALQNNTAIGNGTPVVTVKDEDVDFTPVYKYLNANIAPQGSQKPTPLPGIAEVFAKSGWAEMGSSKAGKYDQRWKEVMIAESKASLLRLEVVTDQTRDMLDALESSG